MFILRRVTSEGNQSNTCLGKEYGLIDSESNNKEFKRTLELKEWLIEEIFAFLTYENGSEIMPLYKKSKYYIMTGEGRTFANLTFKKGIFEMPTENRLV